MTKELTSAYAELISGNYQGVRKVWYRIFFDLKHPGELVGPYRDETDAENAAYEETKIKGLYLEWLYR